MTLVPQIASYFARSSAESGDVSVSAGIALRHAHNADGIGCPIVGTQQTFKGVLACCVGCPFRDLFCIGVGCLNERKSDALKLLHEETGNSGGRLRFLNIFFCFFQLLHTGIRKQTEPPSGDKPERRFLAILGSAVS